MKKLVQAESTAEKGELAAAEVISDDFARSGITCRIDRWDTNRANLTAQITSTGQKPALLFLCHIDVVAAGRGWTHPPFAAEECDGKVFGRGSMDMKGGTAAAVAAVRQIVDSGTKLKGDIIFAALAGEETDSCGAKRFINDLKNNPPKVAGVIVPEPTDFDIVTAHRGILWLEVKTKGRTAHSSMPQLGVNAITSMRAFLNELESYKIKFQPHKLLGDCSMSVNTITAGKEINVVPDNCTIAIDIRTLPASTRQTLGFAARRAQVGQGGPGQNTREIISDFEKIFAKLKQENPNFDASASVVREVGALETDSSCDFVRDFCSAVGINKTKAVGYTTDGPHFVSLGAPIVIFGPGRTPLAHKPDEYIEIADMEKAAEFYKNLILEFLT
ncbi:MAG: M20 family metallopeptidase [Phycisphaerae bacterium]|nr:M20 family metallopeptidase [Phycisphaerae bacterium]